MWNKRALPWSYRSLFLLVRIRSGRFRMTLPLALFLIDETLESVAGLLWLTEKFVPAGVGWTDPHSGPERQTYNYKKSDARAGAHYRLPSHQMLELSRELLNELRSYGKLPLVEVETKKGSRKQHIAVELV